MAKGFTMIVLDCKRNEQFKIGENINIRVLTIGGYRVRLGIECQFRHRSLRGTGTIGSPVRCPGRVTRASGGHRYTGQPKREKCRSTKYSSTWRPIGFRRKPGIRSGHGDGIAVKCVSAETWRNARA